MLSSDASLGAGNGAASAPSLSTRRFLPFFHLRRADFPLDAASKG